MEAVHRRSTDGMLMKRLIMWGSIATAVLAILGIIGPSIDLIERIFSAVELPNKTAVIVAQNTNDISKLKSWRRRKDVGDYYVRYYVTEIAKKNGIPIPPPPQHDREDE